jgi:hypothetical protein
MSDVEKRLDEIAWLKANVPKEDAREAGLNKPHKYHYYHEALLADFKREIEELKTLVIEMRESLVTSSKKRR